MDFLIYGLGRWLHIGSGRDLDRTCCSISTSSRSRG